MPHTSTGRKYELSTVVIDTTIYCFVAFVHNLH